MLTTVLLIGLFIWLMLRGLLSSMLHSVAHFVLSLQDFLFPLCFIEKLSLLFIILSSNCIIEFDFQLGLLCFWCMPQEKHGQRGNFAQSSNKLHTLLQKQLAIGLKKYLERNLFCSSTEWISPNIYNDTILIIDLFYNTVWSFKNKSHQWIRFISELCNKVIAVLTEAVRKEAREVGVVCRGRKAWGDGSMPDRKRRWTWQVQQGYWREGLCRHVEGWEPLVRWSRGTRDCVCFRKCWESELLYN